MTDSDPFDLQRFVTAQVSLFAEALNELRAGRKRSHWMWFVFPQLRGLGLSPTAQFYGITSLDEARAYLGHRQLGERLDRCARTVLEVKDRSVHDIFGSPDDLKFHSSMTLFALAAADDASVFHRALDRWWRGCMDQQTLRLLADAERAGGRA